MSIHIPASFEVRDRTAGWKDIYQITVRDGKRHESLWAVLPAADLTALTAALGPDPLNDEPGPCRCGRQIARFNGWLHLPNPELDGDYDHDAEPSTTTEETSKS